MDSKVPVTILTGFLGSGKTTLLNRILSESHGLRIAVIENEFGEIGIDQDMVINADEEVFEMNNGCICCTVRGDLIRILTNLAKRRDKFDRIVLETTGLADPGPVAQTFFVDDEIREEFQLEGIVTLVDAKHVEQHFDDSDEVVAQIAFADMIVLNKCDLIDAEQQTRVRERIASLNKMATILPAEMAKVPLEAVLDLGGFDLDRALGINEAFLEAEYPFEWAGIFALPQGDNRVLLSEGPDPSMSLMCLPIPDKKAVDLEVLAESVFRHWSDAPVLMTSGGELQATTTLWNIDLIRAAELDLPISEDGLYAIFTEHTPEEFSLAIENSRGVAIQPIKDHYFTAGHTHDDSVTSVAIEFQGELNFEKLNDWFSILLQTEGPNIFRMKGILAVEGNPNKMVFQGVHMLFDSQHGEPWGDEPRHNRLVFIGRELEREYLLKAFQFCLA